MRSFVGLLLAIVAFPAYGQDFTCGPFKAESKKTGAETEWIIALGKDKSSERAALKSGPRFDCIAGEVLVVEFTSAANTFVGLHFPDGNEIGYLLRAMRNTHANRLRAHLRRYLQTHHTVLLRRTRYGQSR